VINSSYTYDKIFSQYGMNVISNDCIQELRDKNMSLKSGDFIYNWIPQSGFQEQVMCNDADILVIGGKRGAGKVNPNETQIVTPFGYRKMGDLKIGSILSNPCTGGMEQVTQIFEHPDHDFYEITFDNGAKVECGLEHLWKVRQTGYIHKSRQYNNTDLDSDWRVLPFERIKKFLDEQSEGKHYDRGSRKYLVVPLCKPVKFTKPFKDKIDIDPYILGCIIGDGCITQPYTVLISIADDFILDYFSQRFSMSKSGEYDYRIHKCQLYDELEKCGLIGKYSHEKFIPEYFKYSSIEDRFALVQGLMDTDGYIDDSGKCYYNTSSEALAYDMKFVLESLGGNVSIRKKKAGYKKNGEYIECKDSYELYIKIKDTKRLFRLPRKADRCKPFNGGVSEVCRRIVSYKYIGKKDGRCITVDSVDGLYMANDFTVTHNTAIMLLAPMRYISNNHFKCVGFRKEEGDISRGIWAASKPVYGDYATPRETDFTWKFPNGSQVQYTHLQNEDETIRRFRGVEIPFMEIDELPQIGVKTFFDLLASNRNSLGIRNQFLGTCNPVKDESHWLYKLLSWYIDKDTGRINANRNGVKRYFYKYGETINDIFWGDSKEEVYRKAKSQIDLLLDKNTIEAGLSWRNMINSICFIEGEYAQNKLFIKNDPNYLGNLAQQGGIQAINDLQGIWGGGGINGNCEISAEDFEKLFTNPEQRSGVRYAVVDVALSKDNLVIGIFDGSHLEKVEVYRNVGSMTAEALIRNVLVKYHIQERNLAFDSDGVGQFLKEPFHSDIGGAIAFNNNSASSDKQIWYNLKAECFDKTIMAIKEGNISISEEAANTVMPNGKTFREELEYQRRILVKKADSNKNQYIAKREMIQVLGGRKSPDEWDMLAMQRIFVINKRFGQGIKGLGLLKLL